MSAPPAPVEVGGAAAHPLAFADLPGWEADDHAAALAAFRLTAAAALSGAPSLRPARPPDERLREAFRLGLETPPEGARAFFETAFVPWRVAPPTGAGFLTGYYEPEVEASLVPEGPFRAPLRARPPGLVAIPEGESLPGVPPHLRAARPAEGAWAPLPDRGAIEDGALGADAPPILWLREPGEAFIVQVQGSARARLPDGRVARLVYDGRNGHPYVSIGRLLVERGEIAPEAMSLERLLGWLAERPREARALMRENPSYVFFRLAFDLDPEAGPIGGAGVPLVPGRSLAVDRTLWPYGLPVFLHGAIPDADGATAPLARLLVAQDTGSAIVGPARGDYFVGGGARAGTRAGLIRHAIGFVVLLPRGSAP